MVKCNFPKCSDQGAKKSRLSTSGCLVSGEKDAYSFREAYKICHYCKRHHDELMQLVWDQVRKKEYYEDK